MISGTTTRERTISPVSVTGFTSVSAIFGGYWPYRVCSGMTMSLGRGAWSPSGSMRTFWMEAAPARISVPEMSTGL